jgi:hypothetical protein
MKKALIFEGQLVQIEAVSFPVAPELIWIDVADDVSMDTHIFDFDAVVLKPTPTAPTYQELRAVSYPSLVDQLDAIWKGGEAEAAMRIIIQSVKDSIPKVKNS